jgi:glutamate synthase domain-containing protein 3
VSHEPATLPPTTDGRVELDADDVRRLNLELRRLADAGAREIVVHNPRSRHNLAVGQTAPIRIRFEGSCGYYLGGLNAGTHIEVTRNVGWGTGEAMAAGSIVVNGSAALGTGASMRGGTIVVRGDCGPRTGACMKGGTLIVEGSVGYLAGFMTHAGDLIVLGDTGEALGDSLLQGRIYVAGTIRGLGNDAKVVEPDEDDSARVHALLREHGIDGTFAFKKVVAEQKLWYFDNRDPEAWLRI